MTLDTLVTKLRASKLFVLLLLAMAYYILSRVPLTICPDLPASASDAAYEKARDVASLQLLWVLFFWLVLVLMYVERWVPEVINSFTVMLVMLNLIWAIGKTVYYFRQPIRAFLSYPVGSYSILQILLGSAIGLVVAWAIYADFFAKKKVEQV